MNKLRQIIVTISLMSLFVLFSCSNNLTSTSKLLSTKENILVKNTWEVEEVMSNVHGKNLHYIKGGINTTGEDYRPYKFTFKSNGTGTYVDGVGNIYPTRWKFTSSDGHNMEFIVEMPNPATFTWNMVEISPTSFQSITALTIGDDDILQSTRCVPIKKNE
ncbi:MAG TPA: hypothetical protein VK718_04050 [Ferruginibacter sp.]|jgi:hypothetical protein|nr:hypothetical protein [Ferruginibacter sp.]